MPDPIQAKLYLSNGTLEGYVRVKLVHWTGEICSLPMDVLEQHMSEPIFSRSGVYLLLGRNEQGKTTVYVGKSIRRRNGNSFRQRLLEHTRDHLRGKWTKAICVTNDESSGNRDLDFDYLEFRCYELVKQAGLVMLNRVVPSQGDPSSDMRENVELFIKRVCLTFSLLGLPIRGSRCAEVSLGRTPPVMNAILPNSTVPQFQLTYKDAKAFARKTEEGRYVLLVGSKVVNETTVSCSPNVIRIREEARRDGALREDGVLIRDLVFDSASGAAKFVCGASVNGRRLWRELGTTCL